MPACTRCAPGTAPRCPWPSAPASTRRPREVTAMKIALDPCMFRRVPLNADSFDHRASSGLRYIVNPPGSPARVHQHLDIGQGEVDWDVFFRTLADVEFDGIATVCVFAWEERARESSA